MIARISALLLAPTFAMADLRVHEWGTFTTLSDSTGFLKQWYSPRSEHSALPKFVKKDGMLMKNSLMAAVRMETPVIYFYPDEPMEVSVDAWFKSGGITEFYPDQVPPAQGQQIETTSDGLITMPTYWKGMLLPPDDPKGLKMIPSVASDEKGAHYAAAREVPEAWIFHHRAELVDPETKKIRFEDQAEKFIFYRGAGRFMSGPSFSSVAENEIKIFNQSKHAVSRGILLQVKNGQARWSKLPEIGAIVEDAVTVSTAITGSWQSLEAVESELAQWFQETLTAEGLTADEATAMIATWHGAWFREPGLRAFTLMSRAQIDEMLPLHIKPAPSKLVRVFVNRHEMLTPHQEQELANLVQDFSIPDKEARERLEKLELGRFQQAALQRSLDVARQRMQMRFHEISSEDHPVGSR